MAIVTPGTDLVITPAEDLIFQPVALSPLSVALTNANWLYLYHRPPLVSVAPQQPSAMTRTAIIVVPCIPSADSVAGTRYDFHTVVLTSNNANITVAVEYCTSYTGLPGSGAPTAWTNIFTQVTAATASVVLTQAKLSQAVPTTAVALRYSVSVSAGSFELHHMLAVPAPTTVPTGLQNSGFIGYDDGLFGTVTNAPVHAELLNRCRRSSIAVLRDRRQMVLSLCADEVQANCLITEDNKTSLAAFPSVVLWFPWQGEFLDVTVYALATVDAGTSMGLLTVSQVPAGDVQDVATVTLDASGTDGSGGIKSGTLRLRLSGEGLMRWARVAVSMKTTSANAIYLHSLVALWQPGD